MITRSQGQTSTPGPPEVGSSQAGDATRILDEVVRDR
jgi:hypothetical protein